VKKARGNRMKTKADDFFSAEEKELVTDSIRKAEGSSSGEIVVMAMDESDSYREGATLGGVVLSGLISLAACLAAAVIIVLTRTWSGGERDILQAAREALDIVTVWYYIPMVCLLYFPCRWLLMRAPRLRMAFLSRGRLEEAVRERTLRAFYEKGLYRTRDATGVLIFISILERRVCILGDRGINEKIPAGFWEERAKELTAGIRAGERGKAVSDVIARCAGELSRFFPRKADDTNELPDEVMS
jgi:putative membrane protein